MAGKYRLEAEVAAAGGVWEFPALFDLTGNRVPAKLITVKDRFRGYGTRQCWAIIDSTTGRYARFANFIDPTSKRAAANLRAKGFVQGFEIAPARVENVGTNAGNVHAAVIRNDRGWPEEVN